MLGLLLSDRNNAPKSLHLSVAAVRHSFWGIFISFEEKRLEERVFWVSHRHDVESSYELQKSSGYFIECALPARVRRTSDVGAHELKLPEDACNECDDSVIVPQTKTAENHWVFVETMQKLTCSKYLSTKTQRARDPWCTRSLFGLPRNWHPRGHKAMLFFTLEEWKQLL